MPTIVDVTINAAGSIPPIKVSPDPVVIPAGTRGPIQWRITNPASQGWKFRDKGIDIEKPGTEFDHPAGGGNRVFTWNNNHRQPGSFKYSVRVDQGTVKVDLDPTILNN